MGPGGRKEVYLGDVRLQYCEMRLFRQKLFFLEWKLFKERDELLYFVVLVHHCYSGGDIRTLGPKVVFGSCTKKKRSAAVRGARTVLMCLSS